jgi:hypothetical protein
MSIMSFQLTLGEMAVGSEVGVRRGVADRGCRDLGVVAQLNSSLSL